jgi:hypothetical protein
MKPCVGFVHPKGCSTTNIGDDRVRKKIKRGRIQNSRCFNKLGANVVNQTEIYI